MSGDLFEPTVPFGEPELMRSSTYRRYLEELGPESQPSTGSTRLSQLSPSLLADLQRFGPDGEGSELIEVLAACVRHAQRVTLQIDSAGRVVPLTVFAPERLVHSPVAMDELTGRQLAEMRVMHVEPALLQPPGGEGQAGMVGAEQEHHPLGPLLWEIAMRGPRRALLPEIEGPAVYRTAPGLDLNALPANGALLASIVKLSRQAASMREIAQWPGMDRERTTRLLNALYLQSGLIVSRSHPDAVRYGWF